MTSSAATDSVLLDTAVLSWDESDEPSSEMFADRYFSSSGGLSESRYVFLEQNDLRQRFNGLGTGDSFTVAETGFGTGLNFLATAQLWHSEQAQGWLHFVSFERYPLSHQDLTRALARWPELAELTAVLLAQYPEAVRGAHRLVWPEFRVRLTLWLGDAIEGLDAFPFMADAWFLDGFNPSNNQTLWNDGLYRAVASHSTPGSTLSTFTVAGAVRRGLAATGFEVRKITGHKPKREMTRATFKPNNPNDAQAQGVPRDAVIVGAGVAGCLLAANLADRGVKVTLVEAGPHPAAGASGNPQGALYTKLAVDYTPQSQLALAALLFAQRYYATTQSRVVGKTFWHPTGLLQLATAPVEIDRQARFLKRNRYPEGFLQPVTAERATALAQLHLEHGGLYFPCSGWLSPALLCQTLCDHPNIRLLCNTTMLNFGADNDGHWVDVEPVGDRAGPNAGDPDTLHTRLAADQLVLCLGASPVLKALGMPIKPIRGQVSWWPAGALPSPECVICGDGYINPSDGTQQTIGATFDLHDNSPDVRPQDNDRNLATVAAWLPQLHDADNQTRALANGRTSFRCTTPDYQPLAGVIVPDKQEAVRACAVQKEIGAAREVAVLAGLGSKGLAFAPLLAEWLSDHVCGTPPALPRALSDQVQPRRFQEREARRALGVRPSNG